MWPFVSVKVFVHLSLRKRRAELNAGGGGEEKGEKQRAPDRWA